MVALKLERNFFSRLVTSLQTFTASSSGLLMIEHELGIRVDSHLELTRFKTIRWHLAAIAGFSSQSNIRSARAACIRMAIPEHKTFLSCLSKGLNIALIMGRFAWFGFCITTEKIFNPTDNSISHFDCLYMCVCVLSSSPVSFLRPHCAYQQHSLSFSRFVEAVFSLRRYQKWLCALVERGGALSLSFLLLFLAETHTTPLRPNEPTELNNRHYLPPMQ